MLDRRTFVAATSAALASAALSNSLAEDAPKKTPIKVCQDGTGHAHAGKLAVFRESPDYEVVGIVESDPALRKTAESQAAFRDLSWMTQEQLLNVAGLQAVLVETRVNDSLDVAEACIAAGKHIHLDKPAGQSLPQLRQMLDSAAKQKLLVQMGYMYRYNPGIVLLRDFLRRGWLGEVFEIHAVMSKVVAPADRVRLAAQFPGGMMFELGCHLIDLVVGVLGKPASVTAFAQHASRQEDKLVDNMLAVFSYQRALATVKSSGMEVEGFARRHLVVCGTEGTVEIEPLDDPAARVALSQPRGEYKNGYQEAQFPKYTRYVDDAADMAKIIRGEKESDFSYQHDLAVQETLLRACRLGIGD